MSQILSYVRDGTLSVVKVTEFDFRQCPAAHQAIESAQTIGKLVLRFDGAQQR